jgi:hypothetical protein
MTAGIYRISGVEVFASQLKTLVLGGKARWRPISGWRTVDGAGSRGRGAAHTVKYGREMK